MKITMDLAHTLLLLAAVVCSANAFSSKYSHHRHHHHQKKKEWIRDRKSNANHTKLCAFLSTQSLEYGRTCRDIGCLPSETCVIASDSCSWNQQEGKECGSYPTCKKSSTVNSSPGKRILNPWFKHAKFDFLIVFVYCYFLWGPKLNKNPFRTNNLHKNQTKPNHINNTSQNPHTHKQNYKKHIEIGLHCTWIDSKNKRNWKIAWIE